MPKGHSIQFIDFLNETSPAGDLGLLRHPVSNTFGRTNSHLVATKSQLGQQASMGSFSTSHAQVILNMVLHKCIFRRVTVSHLRKREIVKDPSNLTSLSSSWLQEAVQKVLRC